MRVCEIGRSADCRIRAQLRSTMATSALELHTETAMHIARLFTGMAYHMQDVCAQAGAADGADGQEAEGELVLSLFYVATSQGSLDLICFCWSLLCRMLQLQTTDLVEIVFELVSDCSHESANAEC